ncbi:hypothetical protein TNCV_710841 [Trichonephila clavipes]|nr:hypothetical protein TNCV_710841 [Trichonephila clavipes]
MRHMGNQDCQLASINAWILYRQTTGENISRQDFLLKLAVELGADFREVREQPKQRKNTKGSSPKCTTDAYQHIFTTAFDDRLKVEAIAAAIAVTVEKLSLSSEFNRAVIFSDSKSTLQALTQKIGIADSSDSTLCDSGQPMTAEDLVVCPALISPNSMVKKYWRARALMA